MLRDSLAAARPDRWRPDFAVDTTVWMRSDAECSPQRGFYYHPSRHSAGQPIVAGWCYSWLVGLSTSTDSWTASLHARRMVVGENTNTVATHQIRSLLPRLGPLPVPALFAFDGGYDPVQLTVGLKSSAWTASWPPPSRNGCATGCSTPPPGSLEDNVAAGYASHRDGRGPTRSP